MGKETSGAVESFAQGLLEYPQYTRPQVWEGRAIPDVLLSGDHGQVAARRNAGASRGTLAPARRALPALLTRERHADLLAAHLIKAMRFAGHKGGSFQ